MQALQLQPPTAAAQVACSRRPQLPRRLPRPPAASADGMNWLSQQAGEVEALAAAEAAAAAADAADDSLARSVGLHLRGRTTFREGLLDEEDPARWVYHRGLKAAALSGNWAEAESIVDEMARAGHVPGSRAYHALVCAHAQADNAQGALGAIRRCWDAGVTPLPETYASVVSAAVAAGDLATAEAVVASNRRAGVDCTRSWQHLVVALLKAGEADKGFEVLAQGEAEGLQLSEGVYEALVELHCREADFSSAQQVLAYMRAGINGAPRPRMQHYVPIINAQAEHGDPEVAYELLDELRLQGDFPYSMLGVCHTVVAAQLRAAQSIEEVKSHVLRMKTLMMRQGLQPGSTFFTAQLQAALRLDDLPTAVQAFKALRQRSGWALGGLGDDELAKLLVMLSRSDLPAELHEVLAVMCREERGMPAAAMAPDAQGCTILGAWVKRRMDQATGLSPAPSTTQAEQEAASLAAAAGPRSCLFIDGVAVDPHTLSCVDAGTGAVLAVSRMGVRELRAELAARKAPVSGNKKELAKRVQKLRQLDDARAALQQLKAEAKKEEQRKMRVIVTDAFWHEGRLVQESRYEDEMEVEAEKEEDEEEAPDWGGEEEEGARRGGGEEEALDGDEEVPFSDSLDRERYVLSAVPLFTSPQASAYDGAAMLLGAVVDLAAAPSPSDLQLLAAWASGSGNVAAAAYLLAALHALGEGPLRGQVPGAVLEELGGQLAEVCAAQGVDPAAVVQELLKDKLPDPEGADALGRSYQDMFAITF